MLAELAPRARARVFGWRSAAFTLVELLAVITIIGLLIGMMLPSLVHVRSRTLRTMCAGNLRQIYVGVTMYTDDYRGAYFCAQDPVKPGIWLWMGRGWRGMIAPYLGRGISQDDPSVLYCKGDPATPVRYESTSYAYSMAFYHNPAQIDAMTSPADTYSRPKPSVRVATSEVRRPARKLLIGEWTANHPTVGGDLGWWGWEGTRNFLTAGGQVLWLEARDIRPANDQFPDPNLTAGGYTGDDLAK